jgi:hypothetical protein
MKGQNQLFKSLSALPVFKGFSTVKPNDSQRRLNVSSEITDTQLSLEPAQLTVYADISAVKSLPESASSVSLVSSTETTEPEDVEDSENVEDTKRTKDTSTVAGSESVEDTTEESNAATEEEISRDESSEEECELCAKIRAAYRQKFKQIEEQHQARIDELTK